MNPKEQDKGLAILHELFRNASFKEDEAIREIAKWQAKLELLYNQRCEIASAIGKYKQEMEIKD